VRGPTLHDLVRRSLKGADPSIPRVCWILAQIARAVDHAWYGTDSAGEPLQVVHRDISLSNILVTHSGTPKLIDFGIARHDGRLTKTDSGVLKGKVQYMAPEQIFAKPLDHRVDVFQLGVALFFATTGRRPFSAASAPELWKQRLSGKIPAPSDVSPDFPEPLDAIIRRAMAYAAEDRYPRARDLAVALEGYLAGLPREPVTEEEIGRWIEALYPPEDRPWQPDVLPETDPSLWRATQVATYEQPSGMTRTHWMAIALALVLTALVAVPGMLVAGGSILVAPELAAAPASVASAPPTEVERLDERVELDEEVAADAVVVDDLPPEPGPRPKPPDAAPKVDVASRVVERGGTRMTIGQDGQMVAVQKVAEGGGSSLLPWLLVGLAMAASVAFLVAAAWWLWVGARPGPRAADAD
jgi:hypothetical protein